MEMVSKRNHGTEIMIYPTKSETERIRSLDYLMKYLSHIVIYEYIPSGLIESNASDLYIVAAAGKPEDQEYRFGWGGTFSESFAWLVAEILSYLLASESNLCVIQDMCQRRSDPYLTSGAPGPVWLYQDQVFWPITHNMAKREIIEKVLGWGAFGRPNVIVFCREPVSRIGDHKFDDPFRTF